MKKLVLLLLLLILCIPIQSFATSYFGFDDYGGQWYDADKINPYGVPSSPDSQMCWAASLSNVLAYTGWDAGYADEDEIMGVFRDHMTNQAGYHDQGLEYWFQGKDELNRVDVEGGGGYYQNEDYMAHSTRSDFTTSSDIVADIDPWLHDGYGVDIAINGNSTSHAMTVYGIEYDDLGAHAGLWVVDSNDHGNLLRYLGMHQEYISLFGNDMWVINGGVYDGWILDTAQGLAQKGDIAPVPEPGTMLLLLAGLPYYAVSRRRVSNGGGA